jgi:hypothetical protein
MRELEFLASLRRLRAIETGGFLGTLLVNREPVIYVIDRRNGFMHLIASSMIPR